MSIEEAMKSADSYKILEEIQLAEEGATLYKAQYLKLEPTVFSGKVVAIKVFKRGHVLENVICLTRDIEHSKISDHRNVTRTHCSFVHDGDIWVVMPYKHATSLARVVARRSSGSGRGLEERVAGFVLREVLKGLDYLHGRQWMHRGFDLNHVFVDNDGGLRIDLDLLAYDPDGKYEDPEAVWTAPPPEILTDEGMELKSDVWCFGIAALKLALGNVPAKSYKELAAFLADWLELVEKEAKTVKKQSHLQVRRCVCFFPVEDEHVKEGEVKKISSAFRKMVADCLTTEPSKRPPMRQLMECDFFRELQDQKTATCLKELLQ